MKYYNIFYVLALIGLISCDSPETWNAGTDSVAPGAVTNAVAIATPGGAIITYDIPNDIDLLGVKAVFEGNDGKNKEVFSSVNRDTIDIVGLGDTLSREVKLYAVDRGMNESEPLALNFNPKESPVITIAKTFECDAAFGGLYLSWKNITKADIGIELWMKDSLGDYQYVETCYSDIVDGEYSFRGLDAVESEFMLEVRDRWSNYSDPLMYTLTPRFEEEIVGKNVFEPWGYADGSAAYRGDFVYYNGGISNWNVLWDRTVLGTGGFLHTGDAGNKLSYYSADYEGLQDVVAPEYMTIDMQAPHSLSRMKLWGRGSSTGSPSSGNRYYQQGNPKYYEIWGCNTPKTIAEIGNKAANQAYWTCWPELGGTDEWKKDWVLLAECADLPPSGALSSATMTVNDCLFADNGFEHEFYPSTVNQKYRYVRFVIKETWGGVGRKVFMNELRFWGEE